MLEDYHYLLTFPA